MGQNAKLMLDFEGGSFKIHSGHLETLFTAAYQPLYAVSDMLHSPLGFPVRISRGMTGCYFHLPFLIFLPAAC